MPVITDEGRRAFAGKVHFGGGCVQKVWGRGGRIGAGERSGGCGCVFRPGLLHEIDDIAILGANGVMAETTNRDCSCVWRMWLDFPAGAFARNR